ncbi:MAG: hypothetical protein HQL30_12545 [Candidatus Omnitrophica bacterium]|nr:hypothetical protein [Candidatus Omnitrophota bacterium]
MEVLGDRDVVVNKDITVSGGDIIIAADSDKDGVGEFRQNSDLIETTGTGDIEVDGSGTMVLHTLKTEDGAIKVGTKSAPNEISGDPKFVHESGDIEITGLTSGCGVTVIETSRGDVLRYATSGDVTLEASAGKIVDLAGVSVPGNYVELVGKEFDIMSIAGTTHVVDVDDEIYIENAVLTPETGVVTISGETTGTVRYLVTNNITLEVPWGDMNTAPGVVISGNQVRILAERIGSYDNPVGVNANTTYIEILQGDIDVSEMWGLGTTLCIRGPATGSGPASWGSISYNQDTHLILQSREGNILTSGNVSIEAGKLSLYSYLNIGSSDQPFNSSVENIGELLSQEGNICFSTDVDITVQGGITAEGGVDILAFNNNVTIPEGVTIRANTGNVNIEPGKGDINIAGLVAAQVGTVRLWTCGNIDLRYGDVKSKNGGFIYNPEDAISVSWVGAGGGGDGVSWGDNLNWSGGNVPNTSAYSVTINLLFAQVTTATNYTIGGLSLGATNTCSLTLGGSLLISEEDVALDGDLLIGGNGTFDANGHDLTVNGSTVLDDPGIFYTGEGGIVTFGNGGSDFLTLNGFFIIEKTENGKIFFSLGGSPSINGTIQYQAMNQATMDIIDWGVKVAELIINSHASSVYTATAMVRVDRNLTVTAGTLDLDTQDLSVESALGSITVNGGTLDLSDAVCDVDVNGSVTVTSGTLKAPAAEDDTSFLVGGSWEISGTGAFTHSGGRVNFDGAGSYTIITSSSNADDFYDVTFNNAAATWTLEDPLTVIDDFTISSGRIDVKTGENNKLTIGGDYTNGDTFLFREGTVEFNGSGVSNIYCGSFYNLTCVTPSKILKFDTFNTHQILGTLTLNGQASGTKIIIDSDDETNRSNILIAGNQTNVNYVDVRNSEITSEFGALTITAYDSTDGSNNDSGEGGTCWVFPAVTYSISGNVYSDLGLTALSGVTIGLLINGTYQAGDQITNGSGAYTFSGITWNNGDMIIVFINGGGAVANGNTVTKVGTSNVVGLDIWGSFLIVRYETGVSITNANLDTALGAYSGTDNDIVFTLDGSDNLDDSEGLVIWTGKTYAPGADINLQREFKNMGTFTHGNKRVTFDGAESTSFTLTAGGLSFYDLTVNSSGTTWFVTDNLAVANSLTVTAGTLDLQSNDLDLNGSLTVNGGTLDLSDPACDTDIDGSVTVSSGILSAPNAADDTSFLVGDGWSITGTGNFTHNNGRVVMNTANPGRDIATSSVNSDDFYQLKINATGSLRLADDLTILDDLIVTGGSLTGNMHSLHVNGDLTVNGGSLNMSNPADNLDVGGNVAVTSGTITAPAAEDDTSFLVGGSWEVSGTGTFTHSSGRVVFDGTGSNTIVTSSSNDDDFYDLKISGTGTWTLEDPLVVVDDLYLMDGGFDVKSGENNSLTIGGDFYVNNSGTFMNRNGEVIFNGSGVSLMEKSVNFYNLTCNTPSKTLRFGNGQTYNITGTLQLNGQAAGTKIILESDSAGTAFILCVFSSQMASYVSVKDSDVENMFGGPFSITAINSTEVSNTDSGEAAPHWIFQNTYDLSGTVYSDPGVTALPGVNIGILINGTYQNNDVATNGSGVYTFSGITWNNGDLVIVFINGNAVNGNTATIVTTANVAGLDIWGETLITRYETGSAITNANLATALGSYSDNDILFTLDGSNNLNLDGGLKIWTGKTFAPGANINIEDSFINSGTFTHGNKCVTFDGGAQGYLVTSNGSGFYDVTVNGAGGGWTATDNIAIGNSLTVTSGTLDLNTLDLDLNGGLTVNGGTLDLSDAACDVAIDGAVTVSSGTLSAPAAADDTSFLVGESWDVSGSGRFIHNNGRVVLGSNNPEKTIITNSSDSDDFYQVKINETGGGWRLMDNLTVLNDLYVTAGTFDADTYDLEVNGDLVINGGTMNLSDAACDVNIGGSVVVTSGALSAPAIEDMSFQVGGSWEISGTGTFTHNNGMVYFYGTGGGTYTIISNSSNADDFYSVSFSDGAGAAKWTLEDPLVVINDFNFGMGIFDVKSGENNSLTVGGDLALEQSGCTYYMREGSVIINGSGTSNISYAGINFTFYDLECSTPNKTLVFKSGVTYEVANQLVLNGQAAGTKIVLQSDNPGSRFSFSIGSNQTVNYVSVKDCEVGNTAGGPFNITANHSAEVSGTDSGEASPRWVFQNTYDISGTVYSDFGETALDGTSIGLIINGTYQGSDQTTDASGAYTFSGIAWNNGDLIIVFINGNAVNGNTATKVTTSNVSGLDIWGETLIVRYETGASITNANLATALGAYSDNDILFSLDGSNNLDINGSLKIWTGKTYAPGADINIEDNFINSGIFTHGNKRVTLDGGAPGYTVTTNGSGLYDVTVNGAGGSWTATDDITIANSLTVTNGTLDLNTLDLDLNGSLTVDGGTLDLSDAGCDVEIAGNVTVSSGTLSAPAAQDDTSFLVAGIWTISGTGIYIHNTGRVVLTGGGNEWIETTSANADDFYQLNINSTFPYFLNDDLTVLDDLFVTSGELDAVTNALTVNGDLTVSGGILDLSDVQCDADIDGNVVVTSGFT